MDPKVLEEAARDSAEVSSDKLDKLRERVAEVRELTELKKDLEERLKQANKTLQEVLYKTLPDEFDELGIDSISLPAAGNLPAVVATKGPYYRANIAAGWDAARREEAFQYLIEQGADSLIKTQLALAFDRGDKEQADEAREILEQAGFDPEQKDAVSHQTLTAWLREQVEKFETIPDLEKIGGTIGQVVKIKETSE